MSVLTIAAFWDVLDRRWVSLPGQAFHDRVRDWIGAVDGEAAWCLDAGLSHHPGEVQQWPAIGAPPH